MVRLDQLEERLEILIGNALNEFNNGNKPKDLPLDKLFPTLCMLKAWDKSHPSARGYKSVLNQFFKFLKMKYPNVKNLRELTPTIVSEYIRHLKDKRMFSKKRNRWESLGERTINAHIKKIRHALEIVDSRGTQDIRERLITIKRPKLKKNIYIPSDEELAEIPEMLKILRKGSEGNKYLAFIAATVLQFCGRTHALSELRFDIIEGLEDGEKPIVSYIGKHGVEQVREITNEWYRSFLKEWKRYVQEKYWKTLYFFPMRENGGITHITDRWFRCKFKEFIRMCRLPQLTVHSFRYIYATKLYLRGVRFRAISDKSKPKQVHFSKAFNS